MALLDEINQLEQQLPNQRRMEFEKKCQEYANTIRKEAVEQVKKAVKHGTCKITRTGYFNNKKIFKSVTGSTEAIHVYGDSFSQTQESPRYASHDGDYWYIVRTNAEKEYFLKVIKNALESEGFTTTMFSGGGIIEYSIKWESTSI